MGFPMKSVEMAWPTYSCIRTGIRIAAVLLFCYSGASELEVVIATWIDEPTDQAGDKSTHTVLVDLANHRVKDNRAWTGGTNVFGKELSSIDDKFEADAAEGASGYTAITMKGHTKSGIRILPAIDYALKLIVSPEGTYALSGCHDDFPSYRVTIDGAEIYEKPHDRIESFVEHLRIPDLLLGCRKQVGEAGTLGDIGGGGDSSMRPKFGAGLGGVVEALPGTQGGKPTPPNNASARGSAGRPAAVRASRSAGNNASALAEQAGHELRDRRREVNEAVAGALRQEADSRAAARKALEDIDALGGPQRESGTELDSVDLGESDDLGDL